jgi:hypothetical protein
MDNRDKINKDKFDTALSVISRKGLKEMVKWLEEKSDFFTAPASTIYHNNFEGGLLDHSINVMEIALHFHQFRNLASRIPAESVIIASLFHDLCKINLYKRKEKWVKTDQGKWVSYMGYDYEDTFPFGHGEKSVYFIMNFMSLKKEEALAIRHHMGPWDAGAVMPGYTKWSMDDALLYPLVTLIQAADAFTKSIEDTIDHKAIALAANP